MSSVTSYRISHFFASVALVLAAMVAGCAGGGSSPWGVSNYFPGGDDVSDDTRAEAFADLRREITAVVSDEERRAAALEYVQQMEVLFDQASADILVQRTKLRQLNWDYYTPQQDFDQLIAETEQIVIVHQDKMLEVRAGLLELLTEAEWDAINRARSRAVDSAFTSLSAT